jgi:hypothetical protein
MVQPPRFDAGPPAAVGPADVPGAAFDPLKLCVFATVALLGWLLGPLAVAFFGGLGFLGYLRARRAGLLRSKCLLGDTRLVLVYLAALVALGATGTLLGWFAWT